MTLKYEIDSLEGVDDAVKPLYAEAEGGKYVLQVEGVVSESKYQEVNQKAVDNATEAARRRKTLERVTGKLGLESADGLDEALDALLIGKKDGKSDKDQEAIIAQIKQQAEAQVKEVQAKLQQIQMQGAQGQLGAELVKVGFPAKAAEMFAAANMNRVQLDDAGNIRIMGANNTPLAGSGADGFAVMGDLAKELAAAMPEFLVDAGKGGGGKPPASGSGGAGAKTVTRSQFDAMSHIDRADFAKQGGKVVDG